MRWAFVLLLCGCFRVPPATVPMAFVADPLPGPEKAKCLLVLFPGARDRAETFREEGYVAEIRRSDLSVDVVAADATLNYYLQSIAAARLEEDVIGPARSKGYDQVWLLGISMGGYGAFHYAQAHPEHVDGIAAFSPFLGKDEVWQSVRDGTFTVPPVAPVTEENYSQQLWGYLKSPSKPELYLGTGDDDRLRDSFEVLVPSVPKDHVYRTKGGHSWGPWRELLKQFLAKSAFKDRCQR